MLEKRIDNIWNMLDKLQENTNLVNSSELYDKIEFIKDEIENASWDYKNLVSAFNHFQKKHLREVK